MRHILSLLLCLAFLQALAQQTVGLFWNDSLSYNGYTLFSPSASDVTYLIDNCGNEVHSWQTPYHPGLTGYMLEDGSLLRAANTHSNINFRSGGTAGRIERYDWNGLLLWSYNYNDSIRCSNHDLFGLPNGNILFLAYQDIKEDTAIALGRNPSTVNANFWEASIIEVEPIGWDSARIVWEWHASDHVVQDFDSTKPNFAPIGSQPHRININYPNNLDEDWLHMNGIDYNAELDQILVSVHRFNELWIIDHSTTTAEAASSSGGNSGKGGDLLYRWGNPAAYHRGTVADQVFYEQHDARWVPAGYPNAGKITVFNNGTGRPEGQYSSVDMIAPPLDSNGRYVLSPGQPFAPDSLYYQYIASPPTSFFSRNISGAQVLPNGNILVCEGAEGRIFEVDAGDSIVWQYVVPVNSAGPITQGNPHTANNTFQAYRYGADYPALAGKSLPSLGPIEQNPLPSDCRFFTADTTGDTTGMTVIAAMQVEVYPNPSHGLLNIQITSGESGVMVVHDVVGQAVMHTSLHAGHNALAVQYLSAGIYIYRITTPSGKVAIGKFIKE